MQIEIVVALSAQPQTRDEAIKMVGAMMEKSGFVNSGYTDSLFQREQQTTTYLGEGVAIPHGRIEDKGMVRKTGLAILQVPQGVAWSAPDERTTLIVGIAASSDAHLGILKRLTRVMRDPGRIQALSVTQNENEIIAALQEDSPVGKTSETSVSGVGGDHVLILNYPNGLHARPAAQWANALKPFNATVRIYHADQVADGRSIPSLLGLGAENGAVLKLEAEGPDALKALSTLKTIIAKLGDEESEAARTAGEKAGIDPLAQARAIDAALSKVGSHVPDSLQATYKRFLHSIARALSQGAQASAAISGASRDQLSEIKAVGEALKAALPEA